MYARHRRHNLEYSGGHEHSDRDVCCLIHDAACIHMVVYILSHVFLAFILFTNKTRITYCDLLHKKN